MSFAIRLLNNQNLQAQDRIINAFETLYKDHQNKVKYEEVNNYNKVLSNAIYSQLQFIYQLIQNKDMQRFIINNNNPSNDENLRKSLISSYQQVVKYLQENSITQKDLQNSVNDQNENSVFESLLSFGDLTTLETSDAKLSKTLRELQNNKDIQSKKMFLYTSQSFIANQILRQYSTSLKNMISNNTKENKQLKEENESLKDFKQQIKREVDKVVKENSQMKQTIEISRKLAKKGEAKQIKQICDAALNEESQLPTRENYIKELEKKVQKQKEVFKQAVLEYEKKFQQLAQEKEKEEESENKVINFDYEEEESILHKNYEEEQEYGENKSNSDDEINDLKEKCA